MDRIDAIVIGAGVVGLAVARLLARHGREVIVVEAAEAIGTGTSSRNSEVIHAGIYYPPRSLKARTCVAGKRALYAFCKSHGVAHATCGKLIVATDDGQVPALEAIRRQATASGVTDLTWQTPQEVRALEPEVTCVCALLSPSTGVVDSHGLMLALQGDLEADGGLIAFGSPVVGGRVLAAGDGGGVLLRVGGAAPLEIAADIVVNAAGLAAVEVARRIAGLAHQHIPVQHMAKGSYFRLAGRTPFRRLIYPVPVAGGLGVHVTIDLAGQARFGPDVEWVDAIDYDVPPARAESFYAAVRRYWPGLPDGALRPDYAGIRPKLHGPGEASADFLVQGPRQHGVPGLVNLFGIESPGLTAALALADVVLAALDGA